MIQSLPIDPVDRRRIQNRNAQRRFRNKKASQNAGEQPPTTSAASAMETAVAATLRGPTIRPRPTSNHEQLTWTGLTSRALESPIGLQAAASTEDPMAGNERRNTIEHAPTNGNVSYEDPSDTFLGYLQQLQDPSPMQTDFLASIANIIVPDPTQQQQSSMLEHHMPSSTNAQDHFTRMQESNVNQSASANAFQTYQMSNNSKRNSSLKNSGHTSDRSLRHTPNSTPRDSQRPSRMNQNDVDDSFGVESDFDTDEEPFQTSLHIAAERGHESIVSMLLSAGSSVDELDSEANTALHRATFNNRVEVVQTLLRHGANPNLMNNAGFTPVHIAVGTGSIENVEALVRCGGDLNKRAKGRLCKSAERNVSKRK